MFKFNIQSFERDSNVKFSSFYKNNPTRFVFKLSSVIQSLKSLKSRSHRQAQEASSEKLTLMIYSFISLVVQNCGAIRLKTALRVNRIIILLDIDKIEDGEFSFLKGVDYLKRENGQNL